MVFGFIGSLNHSFRSLGFTSAHRSNHQVSPVDAEMLPMVVVVALAVECVGWKDGFSGI